MQQPHLEGGAKDNISDFSTQQENRQQVEHHISRREAFLSKCTKYNEIIIYKKKFNVGDSVQLRTTNQQEQIGQIINFYGFTQEDKTIVPLVELQWYCTFSEISDNYDKEVFSEYELFLTEQTSILFIDSILSKTYVLTIDDFENLGTTNAYFQRAKYNTITKQLDPPITSWKKVCVCDQPQNPDLLYIQCDMCNKWFHLSCIGLTQEQANQMEKYICEQCIMLKQSN